MLEIVFESVQQKQLDKTLFEHHMNFVWNEKKQVSQTHTVPMYGIEVAQSGLFVTIHQTLGQMQFCSYKEIKLPVAECYLERWCCSLGIV